MDEIKQALKTKIKELTAELNRAEKALSALEAEKPAKQARAPRAASTSATGSTTTAAKALADTVLTDGALAQLKAVPNSSVEGVAGVLKMSKGKVNAAFKQLVAKGDIIVSGKQGRTKLYSLAPQE